MYMCDVWLGTGSKWGYGVFVCAIGYLPVDGIFTCGVECCAMRCLSWCRVCAFVCGIGCL